MKAARLKLFATTLPKLGIANIARIAAYRLSLKLPVSPIRQLVKRGTKISGPFFKCTPENTINAAPMRLPPIFGFHPITPTATAPDWFENPLTGAKFKSHDKPFFEIADFDPDVGDIKQIWELSRFGWLLPMAQDAKKGDNIAANLLNEWLEDWVNRNPAYNGPNWKCGQEASLRVIHLLIAAYVLYQEKTALRGLIDLIATHLDRISPTVSYAMAQDNNHGTSEAAALFMGGVWLEQYGHKHAILWHEKGRRLLENRVKRLIMDDGCFSQYSVNYHRLMLDTITIAEWWRRKYNQGKFSAKLTDKARKATHWLYRLIEPSTGDAPNIGANDGAHILNLANCDYRDFRPSVCLAYAIWFNQRAFAEVKICDRQLASLSVSPNAGLAVKANDDLGLSGGFARLSHEDDIGSTKVYFRHPRFKFRPSQADLLHVDIWRNGENICPDGGTYSYNTTPEDLNYFGGTASHNTVQFDGRDQMPRISRFLFGNWPKIQSWSQGHEYIKSGYVDSFGASHTREVKLLKGKLLVTDIVENFKQQAIIQWRFSSKIIDPNNHPKITFNDERIYIETQDIRLKIYSTKPLRAKWSTGEESRYYLQKNPIAVLEITSDQDAKIISEFT